MRLISSETQSYFRLGNNFEFIKLFKTSGLDAYDFSMFEGGINRLIDEDDYKEKAADLSLSGYRTRRNERAQY